MTINKTTERLLSVLVAVSLIAPSLFPLPLLALNEGGNTGGGDLGEEYEGEGEDSAEAEAAAAAEAAEAAAADAAQAVNEGASLAAGEAGRSFTANSVGGPNFDASNPTVSITTDSGITIDNVTVDQAYEAAGNIADAAAAGINPNPPAGQPGVDVAATIQAAAEGRDGVVVGNLSGLEGTPQEVANYEIGASYAQSFVGDMTSMLGNLGGSIGSSIGTTDLGSALFNVADILAQNPQMAFTPAEFINNPDFMGPNFGYAGGAPTFAGGLTPVGSNSVTVTSPTGAVTVNIGIAPAPVGNFNTFTPTELGRYETYSTRQTTPATNMLTGRAEVGTAPSSLQSLADRFGIDLSDPEDIVAIAGFFEMDARTRSAITAAYAQDPSFKTLAPEYMEEFAAFISATANEAAARGRTFAEQVAHPAYLTSVVPPSGTGPVWSAYSSNPNQAAAINALAGALIDGSIANERGLNTIASVEATSANHFYAEYANPNWGSQMTGVVTVGPFTESLAGLIPHEANPVGSGVVAALGVSPSLLSSDSLFSINSAGVPSNPNFNSTGIISATPGVTPSTNNTGFVNIDLNEFVNSLPTPSVPGFIGGIPAYTINPTDTVAPTFDDLVGAPITPALRDALIEAGVNPNTVARQIDYSIGLSGVGGRTGQTGTSNNTTVVSVSTPDRVNPVNGGMLYGNSPAYGARNRGPGREHSHHYGTDIYGRSYKEDRAVVSVTSGTVVTVRTGGGYGSIVEVIDEKTGIISFYAHIDPAAGLKVGDEIAQGAPIGKISGTGTDFGKTVADIAARENISRDEAFDLAVDYHSERNWASVTPPHLHYEERTQSCVCSASQVAIDSTASLGYERGVTYSLGSATPNSTFDVTAISVSPQDLASLEAINAAIEDQTQEYEATLAAQNPTTPSTPTSPSTPSTNSGGTTNTNPFSVGGIVDAITSGIGGLFGGWLGGGTNTTPAPGGGETPATSTPVSINSGGALAANASLSESEDVGLFRSIYQWIFGKETVHSTFSELPTNFDSDNGPRPYVPILVQIDTASGMVRFERGSIQNMDPEEAISYMQEEFGDQPMDATASSLLFNERGDLIYSDGMYAPALENGVQVDAGIDYVYLIEQYENGKLVRTEMNVKGLPGNVFTRTLKSIFTSAQPYTLNDIDTVTYIRVDPDTSEAGDEYKEYTVTLKDKSTRTFAIPLTASIDFIQKETAATGHIGDYLALTEAGVEVGRRDIDREPNIIKRTISSIGSLFTGNQNDGPGNYADLGEVPTTNTGRSGDLLFGSDIISTKIYLEVPMDCPDVDGFDKGYVYEVLVDLPDEDKSGVIHGAMCGTGNAEVFASEVAKNLTSRGYFTGLSGEVVTENLSFAFYAEPSTPVAPVTNGKLPNLTNTISFEVKVMNGSNVISDWSSPESINVPSGADLYFRWNGSDYQQCLPFLQDNGNYALTVRNRAMTTGNTESEGYNVTERTAVYRLECGGQRNNEFGVDEREIEVSVD